MATTTETLSEEIKNMKVDDIRIIVLESYYKHGECNMNMFKNETDFKKYISDEYINEFFSRKEESDEESEYDEDEYDDEKEALRKKAKKDSKNLQIQFEKNPENYDWSDESYFNYRTQKAIPPPKSRPLDTDPLLYWVYWIWRHGNYELMSQAGWGVKQIIVEKNGVVKKYQ